MGYWNIHIDVGIFLLILYHKEISGKVNWCYSCGSTGSGADCEVNTDLLIDATKQNESFTFVKECEPPFDKCCSIEHFMQSGGTTSFIRDCSDGETFSYKDPSSKSNFSRLDNLNTSYSNETACVYNGQYLICLSLCNSTDFCNGPSESAANEIFHVMKLLVFSLPLIVMFFLV
ncbi:hypothetical protein CHS0354_023489 [Potamilus streckersoni]|uniref:Protein sleepless n=1 Tax=Potamilus streckersoni TaxID=2493646 RepID=A0AAE0S7G3_9BIVA|nr:hypothetical protein CHS0354_023489 [Potamilus streckersoni]